MIKSNKIKQMHPEWGRSYGEMVSNEFFKSSINIASLIFIVFLFVIAVFAPFIANDKPFVIKIDGVLEFPLFDTLNAVDYSVLLCATIAVLLFFLHRRNHKKVDPSIRGALWARQVFTGIVVFIVGTSLFVSLIPNKLDATDYKAKLESKEASYAIFPIVPYGFKRTSICEREQPPSKKHWFGTDDVGSDVLCRVIHGSRISLSV